MLRLIYCLEARIWTVSQILSRVSVLKSIPAHSFNALIIPILRGCAYNRLPLFLSLDILSVLCTAFKSSWWLLFILSCITTALFIYMDLYWIYQLSRASVIPSFTLKDACQKTGCISLITGLMIACLGMVLSQASFMIRTKVAKLNISPKRLHSTSSVRIPSYVNNFRNMLPTMRLSPPVKAF